MYQLCITATISAQTRCIRCTVRVILIIIYTHVRFFKQINLDKLINMINELISTALLNLFDSFVYFIMYVHGQHTPTACRHVINVLYTYTHKT